MRHKHAELIKKWADDTSLKFQYCYKDNIWNIATDPPGWDETLEYRIKPEVIRYRIGSQEFSSGKRTIFMSIEGNAEPSRPGFIEWLTDWQEVELK